MDTDFKKNFVKGSLATSIGQISSLGLQFISTLIIVRSILKEEFGVFSLIIVISLFLTSIGGLGLNITLIKFLSSEGEEAKSNKLQNLLSLRLASLIIISIFFFIISSVTVILDSQVNDFVFQIIIIFVLNSLREFYYSQLQGLRKFKEFAIVQFSSAFLKFVAIIIGLIFNLLDLQFLIYTEIGALFISFIIQQLLVPFSIKINLVLKTSEVKEIMNFAYPLYLNNLLAVLNNRANAFIITGYLGTISLASYEVANKIPDALKRMYSSFVRVFFPNISYLISENRKKDAHQFINSSISSINFLLIPVIMIIYVFQHEITISLFSEQYINSSLSLFLFMVAFYFHSVNNITGYSLVAMNRNILSFKSNLYGVILGLIISIILTPLLGFEGAVYAVISSRFISSALGLFFLNSQQIKVRYFKTILPLLFCAPFIILYEGIGIDELHYKIILIIIFVFLEIIIFKEFRKTLLQIFNLFKSSKNSSLEGTSK
jgi:O-antigen/teichoic acid export membrane protein